MENQPKKYDESWADLRRRIQLFWLLFLAGFCGMFLIASGLDTIHSGLGDRVGEWIVIPYIAGIVGASFYVTCFPCPRCGDWFFSGDIFRNGFPFRRKCIYCGLRLWQSSDDSKDGLTVLESTKARKAAIIAGLLGLIIPIVVEGVGLIHPFIAGAWLLLIWPGSIMLMALENHSSWLDAAMFLTISILINMLLYGVVGWLICFTWTGIFRRFRT
jgi:hypothetical protein